MTRRGFRRSQFPDDENRDGSRNVGSLAIRPSDAAAYWLVFICTNIIVFTLQQSFRNLCNFTASIFNFIMTSECSSRALMCSCRATELSSVETLARGGKCIILGLIFNGHSTCSFPAWSYISKFLPQTPSPRHQQILLHIKIGRSLITLHLTSHMNIWSSPLFKCYPYGKPSQMKVVDINQPYN